jgi:pimeloyl-ACP methyl ester carboxylesterase
VGHIAARRRSVPWTPPSGVVHDAGLSVRVTGDGSPTWVLLHGMFRSGRYWSADYDALGGTVVAPDLLGFGRSRPAAPADAADLTADAHADAVVAAVRDVGVAVPAVFVGHSTGALVALHVARREPELVAGVVAVNPPLYPDRRTARQRLSAADPYTRLFLARPPLSEAVCELMCRYRTAARIGTRFANPALPAPLNDDAVEHTWPSFNGTLEGLVLRDDHERWIDEVSAPVRIIAGADDRLIDLRFLRRLSERTGVDLDEVAGGHDLPLRHPGSCVTSIRMAAAAFGLTSS